MKLTCAQMDVLISFYLDGELSVALKKQVEEHMQACATCRAKFDIIKSMISDLKNCCEVEKTYSQSESFPNPSAISQQYRIFKTDLSAYIDNELTNDENIKIGKSQNNFALRHIFRVENQYLGIFQNMLPLYDEDKFFCKIIDTWNKDRKIYVFDFEDLINGCLMLNNDEKLRFKIFKNAMRRRQVSFEDANAFYLAQEIFNLI